MADPSKIEFMDRLKGTSPVNDPQGEQDSLVQALMDAASSAGQSYADFTTSLLGALSGRGRGAAGAAIKIADPIVRQIPPIIKQIPQDLSDAGRYLTEATYQHLERTRRRPSPLDTQRAYLPPPPLSPEAERGRTVVAVEAGASALFPGYGAAKGAVKGAVGAVKRGVQAARGVRKAGAELAEPGRAAGFARTPAVAWHTGSPARKEPWQMTGKEFEELRNRENFVDVHAKRRYVAAIADQFEDLPTAMRLYGRDFAYESPGVVRRFSGIGPEDRVTLYRAISADDPAGSILPGDWVALERKYAEMHGSSGYGGVGSEIVELEVPARDVIWAGTSGDEWHYAPKSAREPGINSAHEAFVRDAVREGRPVPPEVLKDYPGLIMKPTQTPAFKRWFGKSKVVDEAGEPVVVYHGTSGEFTEFDPQRGGAKTGAESASMGIFFTDNPKVADPYSKNIGMGGMLALSMNPNHPLSRARTAALDTPRGRSLAAAASAEEAAQREAEGAWLDEYREVVREMVPRTPAPGLSEDDKARIIDALAVRMRADDPRMAATPVSPHRDRLEEFVLDAIEGAVPSRTMPVYLSIKNPKVYDAQGKTPDDFPLASRIRAAKEAGHDGVVFKNLADPDLPSTHYIVFDPTQIKSATGNVGTYSPMDPSILMVGQSRLLNKDVPFASVTDDTGSAAAATGLSTREIDEIRIDYDGPIQGETSVSFKVPVLSDRAANQGIYDTGSLEREVERAHRMGDLADESIELAVPGRVGPLVRGMSPDDANAAIGLVESPLEYGANFVAADKGSSKSGVGDFITLGLAAENPGSRQVMFLPDGRAHILTAKTIIPEAAVRSMVGMASLGRQTVGTHSHPFGIDPKSGRQMLPGVPFFSFGDIVATFSSAAQRAQVVSEGRTSWFRNKAGGLWVTKRSVDVGGDFVEEFVIATGRIPLLLSQTHGTIIPKGLNMSPMAYRVAGDPKSGVQYNRLDMARGVDQVLGFLWRRETQQANLDALMRANLSPATMASVERQTKVIGDEHIALLVVMGDDYVPIMEEVAKTTQRRFFMHLENLFDIEWGHGYASSSANKVKPPKQKKKPKRGR